MASQENVLSCARDAREAAASLAIASRHLKDTGLNAMADALEKNVGLILIANEKDLEAGRESGMSDALLDRLALNESRVEAMAAACRNVAGLPDPVSEVIRGYTLPNGLQLRQVRVPLGVVAVIYEGRPNVTVDAAALTLKSGNAALLRGSASAYHSNSALVAVLADALEEAGLPRNAIQLVPGVDRESVTTLMRARGLVDVIIPRGGAGLINSVVENSIVPVIETGTGNCHVYVDASADLDTALDIVVNAKVQRPSVCNSAETLLVHSEVAGEFLPRVAKALGELGVTLHADDRTLSIVPAELGITQTVIPATEEDWDTEYLSLDLAVAVVDSTDDAIAHIAQHSSGHTEAICAKDVRAIRTFVARVDSAAVMVNASTRFTDGEEFGFGAEIGISTQKLHARGPLGLPELTSTKYVVIGDGHVRG